MEHLWQDYLKQKDYKSFFAFIKTTELTMNEKFVVFFHVLQTEDNNKLIALLSHLQFKYPVFSLDRQKMEKSFEICSDVDTLLNLLLWKSGCSNDFSIEDYNFFIDRLDLSRMDIDKINTISLLTLGGKNDNLFRSWVRKFNNSIFWEKAAVESIRSSDFVKLDLLNHLSLLDKDNNYALWACRSLDSLLWLKNNEFSLHSDNELAFKKACYHNEYKTVDYLLKDGVDKSKLGESFLDDNAAKLSVEIFNLLYSYGFRLTDNVNSFLSLLENELGPKDIIKFVFDLCKEELTKEQKDFALLRVAENYYYLEELVLPLINRGATDELFPEKNVSNIRIEEELRTKIRDWCKKYKQKTELQKQLNKKCGSQKINKI